MEHRFYKNMDNFNIKIADSERIQNLFIEVLKQAVRDVLINGTLKGETKESSETFKRSARCWIFNTNPDFNLVLSIIGIEDHAWARNRLKKYILEKEAKKLQKKR